MICMALAVVHLMAVLMDLLKAGRCRQRFFMSYLDNILEPYTLLHVINDQLKKITMAPFFYNPA